MIMKTNRMIEKMGHYEINHLKLGEQKLNRHPGCGSMTKEEKAGKDEPCHGVVGIIYCPKESLLALQRIPMLSLLTTAMPDLEFPLRICKIPAIQFL